jgi:hypothetical protein
MQMLSVYLANSQWEERSQYALDFQASQRTPMDDWIFMASGEAGTTLSGPLDWLAARWQLEDTVCAHEASRPEPSRGDGVTVKFNPILAG